MQRGKNVDQQNKKKEPWRIIVGILSIGFVALMWIKKDVLSIYTTMPQDEAIPLVVTTIAVSAIKVAAITGGILLVKWIIKKVKR
jgi:hypothetical protein